MGRTATPLAIDPQQAEDARALGKLAVDADTIGRLLGVGKTKVYELTKDPNDPLPHVKLGERTVFPVRRVAAWLEARADGGKPIGPPPIPPALLNAQDAASVLGGIDPDQLPKLDLPTVTIAGQTLYPVEAILRRVGELATAGASREGSI